MKHTKPIKSETVMNTKLVTPLILILVIISAALLFTSTQKPGVVTGKGFDESIDEITPADPLDGLALADGILQDLVFDQQNTNGFTACIPEYIKAVPTGPWPEDDTGRPLPAYNELQEEASDQKTASFVAVNPSLIRFEGSCQTALRTFELLGTHQGIQEGLDLSYDVVAPPKNVVCPSRASDACSQAGGRFVPTSSIVHEALFDANDGGFNNYLLYKHNVDPQAPPFVQAQQPDVCVDVAYIVTECACVKQPSDDTFCWAV